MLLVSVVSLKCVSLCMHVEGKQKGAIAGVLWGGLALGLHHMSETYRPGDMLKHRLVALDLLDDSSPEDGR